MVYERFTHKNDSLESQKPTRTKVLTDVAAAGGPPRNTPASEEPWTLLEKMGMQRWVWGQMRILAIQI